MAEERRADGGLVREDAPEGRVLAQVGLELGEQRRHRLTERLVLRVLSESESGGLESKDEESSSSISFGGAVAGGVGGGEGGDGNGGNGNGGGGDVGGDGTAAAASRCWKANT